MHSKMAYMVQYDKQVNHDIVLLQILSISGNLQPFSIMELHSIHAIVTYTRYE